MKPRVLLAPPGYLSVDQLKIRAAQSPHAQRILSAMQPVMQELLGEVQRSLGFYKSISKSVILSLNKNWPTNT